MNNPTFKREDCLILIVDDDRTMRYLLKMAMEEEGYQVIEAKEGQQCLEEYHRHRPDMVLLDALMPGMDGFTCCQKLRSVESDVYLPILMITALDDQESIDQAFLAGATDYITKPIFWSVLSRRVNHLLLTCQALRESMTLNLKWAKQEQWQHLNQQITRQWQQSFQIKSLFQDCLEKLQIILKAERVGIHRLDGKLMAEAIAVGYPSVKTLEWDKIILLTLYQSQYEQGETITLDFSRELDLCEEAIAPFEQLAVQQLTLMPLVIKENLWGILWIHYCRSCYHWESWEKNSLSHLRDLLAVTCTIID
ncbi:two-component response regulator [Crocosphaera subtropica ATCC 51142]|uniref:Two-component response regulator n=1 Tax=Crocosphaera subtropica (strain ATCC 51142 / BH68) TaxID=43989 RepID=B1WQ86_CROS5|nr:response regulator [Crocosphaera subtropica]ACB50008.1 two-component response regulator [Crocosphaera subtropica ATCC 51142]